MSDIIKVRVPEYSKICGAAGECECIIRALGYSYVKVYGTYELGDNGVLLFLNNNIAKPVVIT